MSVLPHHRSILIGSGSWRAGMSALLGVVSRTTMVSDVAQDGLQGSGQVPRHCLLTQRRTTQRLCYTTEDPEAILVCRREVAHRISP